MYRKILVPMALDHGISPQILEIAHAIAEPDAEIRALHVHEAPEGGARAYLDEAVIKSAFEQAHERLKEVLKGTEGIKAETVMGHTARTIIDYAADHGTECIVIGSHRPGLSDYFLGSTAARVVRHAPCDVHVHRTS